jgi:hypothetical protein
VFRVCRMFLCVSDTAQVEPEVNGPLHRGVQSTLAGTMLVVCILHSSVCAAVIDFFNCDPPTGENGYEAGALHAFSTVFRFSAQPEPSYALLLPLKPVSDTTRLIPRIFSRKALTLVELKSGRG